ncbi:MAG: hypothetical protein LBC68_01885 [Prevotellaceae bacterium]|jgi:hypothetical protein|nr:hypothetical protein [Prevotellaceae bacterium]
MEKYIKPCKCGSIEFISKPNRYDIYEIIDKKLTLIHSEETEDEFKLYCRECGREFKNCIDFVT